MTVIFSLFTHTSCFDLRAWRNWQTRWFQVPVGDHAGSSPVARTTKKTSLWGGLFLFRTGLEPNCLAILGSPTARKYTQNVRSLFLASFFLISFGRFMKNSYQLFFPRLPVARTTKKTSLRGGLFLFRTGLEPNCFAILGSPTARKYTQNVRRTPQAKQRSLHFRIPAFPGKSGDFPRHRCASTVREQDH